MNPFRLIGRVLTPSTPEAAWQPPTSAPSTATASGTHWPPGSDGPATRAARPAAPRAPTDDPPTDPHGWPPVAGLLPGGSAPTVVPAPPRPPAAPRPASRPASRSAGRPAIPDHAEAAGLAAAFAVDYLSWDEQDPARRGRVLTGYLHEPGPDPSHLGWSGRGRQRAELAVPGRLTVTSGGRLLVDLRVRVTPYEPIGPAGVTTGGSSAPAPDPHPDPASAPAVAPAPAGRGWRSVASRWVRLCVPVICDGDRLAIDRWDQPRPAGPEPFDPRRRGAGAEDPLTEPAAGDVA